MNCPSPIREYRNNLGIQIFDDSLDEQLSTYNEDHLDEMAKTEKYHFWLRARRDKICNYFEQYVDKKCKILEIGCGTGFVAEKLQRLGFSIEVSDTALNGLTYAKRRGLNKLYQFDLFNPPFVESFDVICIFDVLEHLNNDILALEKIQQMLKPEGKIILTVPAHQWLWNRDDVVAGHKRRYSKRRLKKVLQISGLQIHSLRYFFILILPFLVLRKFIKKNPGRPIEKEERVDLKIAPLWNQIFHFLTKFEFKLEKWLPNVMGGSLIGIAKKK